MTCEVCEHCEQFVFPDEESTLRSGFSYHKKCHKCYVCDETNLEKAEVFKGVIFCEGCAKRIFQGCSTARRAKNNGRIRRPRVSNAEKPRFHRSIIDRAIELSNLTGSSGHCHSKPKMYSETNASRAATQVIPKTMSENRKIHSSAVGEHASCLTTNDNKPIIKDTVNTYLMQSKRDLRIAGIGTSKEIANMPLRKRSEVTLTFSQTTKNKPLTICKSYTLSILHQGSSTSKEGKTWSESTGETLDDADRTYILDRRLGSILRIPYDYFMRNIVHRSSRIAIPIKLKDGKDSHLYKIKKCFHEEIIQHQGRGTKVLYPTINRKQSYKLGWLKVPDEPRCPKCYHKISPKTTGCKHFRASHSYRCMRKKVMKLAGPTKSELARFRRKIQKTILPDAVFKMLNQKYHFRQIETTSTACGDNLVSINSKGI